MMSIRSGPLILRLNDGKMFKYSIVAGSLNNKSSFFSCVLIPQLNIYLYQGETCPSECSLRKTSFIPL